MQALAGALEAAHRLGLAHGRLGPGQVLLDDLARPKLDFTGTFTGFPADLETAGRLDGAYGEPVLGGGPAVDRAADLYSLGALLVWLLTGRPHRREEEPRGPGLEPDSPLGNLARRLLAAEPAERPTAHEVRAQLAGLFASLEATGNWNHPVEMETQPTLGSLRESGLTVARCEPETLVVETSHRRLGRYRLLEKLGEGGQGVVFRASDPAEGSVVAIKVLRAEKAEDPNVLRRFRKEARLMAEANNPQVVNLLEYNEEDGIPYLVLEFVTGETLSQLLAHHIRLDEPTALAIMADVARGLMQAHERGIVHRDIKPSNILLLGPPAAVSNPFAETLMSPQISQPGPECSHGLDAPTVVLAPRAPAPDKREEPSPRIKISDFGLARHVVDSESLALTAAGALMGTPHYMSPEQWTGRAIDPRTDVYAMGATLFHLLAGRPPFAAETRDALALEHCNEPPPSLTKINPNVSDGAARLVERALAKRPEDRFVNAGAMLRQLEALIHGKPADATVHPRLPVCAPGRVMQFEFRWELESAPRQLWPLVTNTDRLDRAIGFPAVRYTTRFEPGRGVRTFAEGRKAGMVEISEEHAYEWVEPRRMGVLREYSQGPFLWLVSVLELVRRPDGGTTLVHRLQLEPRSWKIRVGSRWGVGRGLRKRLESVYRRIDATVQSLARSGRLLEVDPFEEPVPVSRARRQRLDRLLDRLAQHGVDAGVVERLGEHLARGAPQEIARIRPLALADRLRLDRDQVVAACLHGAREGLLELHWDLLCPVCRISCMVTDTLRAIGEHGHCEACNLDFRLDLANSIELIFRVHPEIRAADLGTYCIGGPAHSPHVFAQIRVAPGERLELELKLPAGSYRLRGPQLPRAIDFLVTGGGTVHRWEIDLANPVRWEPGGVLGARCQTLVLTNAHDCELVVRIERAAPRNDALTAARAACLGLFRELFPDEVLAPGQLASVSTATFLLTALDAAQADALYQDLGDAQTFRVLHEHFERLSTAIRQGGGAVVKTVGEGVLAAFTDVAAAVRTALDLRCSLTASAATSALCLRMGIHSGTTLAATLNDNLEYFGTTARQAAKILPHAGCNELVLTQAVAADPEVAAILQSRAVEGEVVPTDLAGQPYVIRVRLEAAEAKAPDAKSEKPRQKD
jgi:serine/threonine protein kinase/class 3 adenylate cyclase